MQYVQIVWAIALGALFYNEYPDALAYIGMAVVVASGLVNVFLDGARIRIAGRVAQYRARREGSPTNISELQGPEV